MRPGRRNDRRRPRIAANHPIRRFRLAGENGGLSLPAALFIAIVAAVTVALVVFLPRHETPPLIAVAPTSAPAPAAAAPTTAVESKPIFDDWLRFEPAELASRADLRVRFFDAMLAHQIFQFPPQGLPPHQARELLLDDDKQLFSSGRRLWNHELLHQPGFAGKFCYLHSQFQLKRLFDVTFFVDGKPILLYDNQYKIERAPSHVHMTYHLGGVIVEERKFITDDDRAVATYEIYSNDKQAHEVGLEVSAPYLTMPASRTRPEYPLMGVGSYQGIPVYAYLDAPGFTRVDAGTVLLRRTLTVADSGERNSAQVALSFENEERHGTPPSFANAFDEHEHTYNQWFADNVPYFDAADGGFKRMWYYRWWIAYFNRTVADTPDLKGYRFYEGKMGFDNPITFATPAHLKELTYLRDPEAALQQAENAYRNQSPSGAIVDPPGSPYWQETYSHWGTAALAEYHRVHPIPAARLRAMLPAVAADVRAWLTTYDGDGDSLPERQRPRVTGYDLDILSYWFWVGTRVEPTAEPPNMERVDFASFVYANARGAAELARAVGDDSLAAELDGSADKIRKAALAKLWEQSSEFFYPQRANDDARAPIRELHGFFPFLTQLAPNEPRYLAALKKFVDPDEFWARFPPVITSQYHYKRWTWEMDGLTRNIAPHPISMGARTLIQVLKHYKQSTVTAAHFMELMKRYNELVYPGVNPFDPYWRPNVHEYYSKWEPYQISPRPKPSDISHDFHSMYNSLIVEGVVGLTPRSDDKIELQPLALDWPYFALHRLRHRGHDLTILWDQPDGNVRYNGFPEGFSLYIDGKQAFTRPQLEHVIYNPGTATVQPAS